MDKNRKTNFLLYFFLVYWRALFIQNFRKRKLLSITCNIFHAASFLAILFGGVFTKNPWVILVSFMLGAFVNSIASISRLSSVIPLSKQYEPPMAVPPAKKDYKFRIFLARLLHSNFGRFALFSFILTFAVNIMAPVIPVFLLQSLHFNYIQYMVIMMSSMVSSFIAMSYWGPLADRYGNYRILIVTAVSIPFIAFGWIMIKNFYLLVFWQLFSGFIWSGFNLSNV